MNHSKLVDDTVHDSKFDDIEDDDQYYKVLLGDIKNQSTTSLYASTPENVNELKPDDEFMGEAAIHNMHSKFKVYKQIKEREVLEGKNPHFPLVEFLDATDNKKILPKSIGLINKKDHPVDYPLEIVKTIFVGKDYAEPFAEGIKIVSKLKELDLTSSDLHYEMLLPILKKLPMSIETLILKLNYNFTPKVYRIISNLVEDSGRM